MIDGKIYAGISPFVREKTWAEAQVLGICKRGGRESRQPKHHLGHGVMIGGGITPGHVVLKLALDIGEQARCPETEEVGFEPAASKFLAHQDQPFECRLSGRNAPGGLEADAYACAFMIG